MWFMSRSRVLLSMVTLALWGCGGANPVPSQAPFANAGAIASPAKAASPVDTTSILKKLTKDVEIGSTVDPTNGDEGPHSITMAPINYGEIKKGDLLVCDFSNSAGDAGKGESIELMGSTTGSTPATFYQGSSIEGCDGSAITSSDQVYVTGATGKAMVQVDQNGDALKTYGSPIVDPVGDGYVGPTGMYSYEYAFSGDGQKGALDRVIAAFISASTKKALSVVTGFNVNKETGWSAQGPSGLAYTDAKKIDTMYVVDGACNTVDSIYGVHNLLVADEITVSKNCTAFKCKDAKATCAKVVLSGKPLAAPVTDTILPNGNIIVANTGSNELVEMTPKGQVLDTKVVDTNKTAGIFGLLATGTNDTNTVLFYTDANTNTVQELEP
jgi:hypothetical protein